MGVVVVHHRNNNPVPRQSLWDHGDDLVENHQTAFHPNFPCGPDVQVVDP